MLNIFVWLINVCSKSRLILIFDCSRIKSSDFIRFLLMIYFYLSKIWITVIDISRVCLIRIKVVPLKLFFHFFKSSLVLKFSWTICLSLRRIFERNAWYIGLLYLLLETYCLSLHKFGAYCSWRLSIISIINNIKSHINSHYLLKINVILSSKLI